MKRRVVLGSGPTPADIAILGQNPGRNEHLRGKPFVGRSGTILNVNLFHAGIDRSQCYVGNVYPYYLGRTRAGDDIAPTEEQIDEALPVLQKQLEKVRPRIIASVGAPATKLFLGNVTMEAVHGIPHWIPDDVWALKLGLTGDPPMVLPIVHPAAGFRKEQEGVKSYWDTKQLGLLARGKLTPIKLKPPVYTVESIPGGLRRLSGRVSMDTEGTKHEPLMLSYSLDGKHGVVVYPSLQTVTLEPGTLVRLHYAVHDIPVLRNMGVNIDQCKIEDSIILAYVLGIEPRGLKDLARRHLHFEMMDYDDVVGPYLDAACLKYILRALKADWGRPKERLIVDPKTRKLRPYQPHGINTRFKSMVSTYQKKHEVDWDKRFDSIPRDQRRRLVKKYGKFPRKSTALRYVPKEERDKYSALDAVATDRVHDRLWEMIDAQGLREVAEQDTAIVPLIERMERVGIKVDTDHFKIVLPKYVATMKKAEDRVVTKYNGGRRINLGSADQVRELLYKRLRLDTDHFTKKGKKSVGKKALVSLRHQHKVINDIFMYKQAKKLQEFAVGLPRFVEKDGRIRGTIKYWNVISGRFSMAQPNMQQIPTRTEEGREIRNCFIADEDHVLLSSDYDQLEMKVMAHFSKDKRMMKIIRSGGDIHEETAAMLFGVKVADVTKLQRTVIKNANYGILYQIQEVGLYDQLKLAGVEGYSIDDCARLLTEWYNIYSGVSDFIDEVKVECRRFGGVRSLHGRLRMLPGIYSPIEYMAAEAARKAVSHKISATATDIIKRAMRRVDKWLTKTRLVAYAEAILQIHDEMLFELHEELSWCGKTIQRLMTADSDAFRVPITAGANVGHRWGELK